MVISLRSLLFSGLTRRGFQTQTNVEPQQGILKQGVTLLSTNTDSETVLGWRKMASEIAQELKEQAGTLEVGQHKGFKEVFQSAEGSYHFSLSSPSPHDHNSARSLMEEYSFAKHTQTRENRTENLQSQLKTELLNHIEKHAHKLFCSVLSPSYQQRGQELLVAYPSSPAQKWHTNASPLFGAQELEGNLLPPYDLTVFIPLDTPDPTLGFTEFACGSQKLTISLERKTPEGRYPSGNAIDSFLQRSESFVQLDCEPGDIAVMDSRVLHRSRSNKSITPRHTMCFNFCRWWYHAHPQPKESERTLFGE